MHMLYHDSRNLWRSSTTLEDALAHSAHVTIDLFQVAQLARLFVLSHLFFADVRKQIGVKPQLSHYRFFCRPGENDMTWLDADTAPLLWFSIGFGLRGPYDPRSQVDEYASPATSIIELALLLFQIGSDRRLDYRIGEKGLINARAIALNSIGQVEPVGGWKFQEIVHECLVLRMETPTGASMARSIKRREDEVVRKVTRELDDWVSGLSSQQIHPKPVEYGRTSVDWPDLESYFAGWNP